MAQDSSPLIVKGIETRNVEIQIDQADLNCLLRSGDIPFKDLYWALSKAYVKQAGFSKDCFIKDGYWTESVTYHTSHSWDEDEKRREATPAEIEMYNAIDEIRRLAFKQKLLGEESISI